ncbi:hypothetical protein H696_03358 [Fonticula alba]|uniref:XPG N-terminal domain-containing protein n=1 Tax=Fonticula alba TaxID=691883 RepID=A0A058Z701_FONAL|nr:hypothetical protein H696_03358 [Fonticula alba]KCV69891.1 hypothetical protein H696_03358 [Fonticula alba]|eukprot:XP_009495497.1 hypothetical protein H696_03358 [Fonticula alba]
MGVLNLVDLLTKRAQRSTVPHHRPMPSDAKPYVLPIDLNNFLNEMIRSNFLYHKQTRSIGYTPRLIGPYLDALIMWLHTQAVYPIFVADGPKAPEKEATSEMRFKSKVGKLRPRQLSYLSVYQDATRGGPSTGSANAGPNAPRPRRVDQDHIDRHLRGTQHLPTCHPRTLVPTHNGCTKERCMIGCQICCFKSRRSNPWKHAVDMANDPFTCSVDLANVWAITQGHLLARARQAPLRLAFIGSFTEADDILVLLSLHFRVPVLSNDSDFFVHGYGQTRVSSLFQSQFLLSGNSPGTGPSFRTSGQRFEPKTLLTSDMAAFFQTTVTKLCWLPLILGSDLGPPDWRIRKFIESDTQFAPLANSLRSYFNCVDKCFQDVRQPHVPGQAPAIKDNWRETILNSGLDIDQIIRLLGSLPEPDALEAVDSAGARRSLPFFRSGIAPSRSRSLSHLVPALQDLRRCSGPGVLLLRAKYREELAGRQPSQEPINPLHKVKSLRDGVLLCLGISTAGLCTPDSVVLSSFSKELEDFLHADSSFDKSNLWCLSSERAPPRLPRADDAAGGLAEDAPVGPPPAVASNASNGRRPGGRAAAPAGGGASGAEASTASAGPPQPPAHRAKCRCREAPYLSIPLLHEGLYLPLTVQAFFISRVGSTAAPGLTVADVFLAKLDDADGYRAASLPLLPQFSLRDDLSVWAPSWPIRFLLYALLSHGKEGLQGPAVRKVIEFYDPPVRLDGQKVLPSTKKSQDYLLKGLSGEIVPLLRAVDVALADDAPGSSLALDRILLTAVLLSSRPSRAAPGEQLFDTQSRTILLRHMALLVNALLHGKTMAQAGNHEEDLDAIRRKVVRVLPSPDPGTPPAANGRALLHDVLASCLSPVPPAPSPPQGPPSGQLDAPSPARLSTFSSDIATVSSWLDLYSVLAGRQLLLDTQHVHSERDCPFVLARPAKIGDYQPSSRSIMVATLLQILAQRGL